MRVIIILILAYLCYMVHIVPLNLLLTVMILKKIKRTRKFIIIKTKKTKFKRVRIERIIVGNRVNNKSKSSTQLQKKSNNFSKRAYSIHNELIEGSSKRFKPG